MNYELVYIINPNVEEEARKELITRFNGMIEQNGGTVDKVDEWGKRRLAYPIKDLPEGYYVLVHYTAESTVPKEIERNMGITDNILRYLTTRIEHKTTGVKPRTARITPSAPEAAAPVAEAPVSTAPVVETPAVEEAPAAQEPQQAEESAPQAE